MKRRLAKFVPEPIKARIRRTKLYDRLAAKWLASTSKRVDLCAAQFASILHQAGHPSLEGKTCLEIGCGWVLSHAIVCHLLGAKRVIATDILPRAQPRSLYQAIHRSIPWIPQDILSPFAEHSEIRARMERLLSIRRFDFEVLKHLGIEYVSPIDLAEERVNVPMDLVYSLAVLEHVACEDVLGLLNSVVADLAPGGTMIHCIHLEDHKNTALRPFDFFSIPLDKYSRAAQGNRGNRIRSSQWQEIFSAIDNTESEVLYEWRRQGKQLPTQIDPSVRNTGEADLRVSHLGIITKKRVCSPRRALPGRGTESSSAMSRAAGE